MDIAVLNGIITAVCGLMGSGLGVVASSRLTNYRLQQLEEKVDELAKRNDDITVLKEQMKGVLEDVKTLKKM